MLSQQSLLFLSIERPNKTTLSDICYNRNIKRLIVLRPSETSHWQYVCYLVKKDRKDRFINYDATKISNDFGFMKPNFLGVFTGGRDSTHRSLFFSFIDPYNLENQLYYTYGYHHPSILPEITKDLKKARLAVLACHPKLTTQIRDATPISYHNMVEDVLSAVIRRGGSLPSPHPVLTLTDVNEEEEEQEEEEEELSF